MTSLKNILSTCFTTACTLAAACGILLLPASAAGGAGTGLSFCANILIPSLFPFMVLSSFVVKSGLSSRLSVLLNPVTRRLFRLPGCTGATIVIGLVGGYPTGARGIQSLIDQKEITPKQGERMLSFCVGAGPAFVISVVGAGLLGSPTAGVILFASQAVTAILIGVFTGVLSGETIHGSSKRPLEKKTLNIANALVESTSDSTRGMLNMCAFVVLFSAVLTIMKDSGVSSAVTQCLLSLGVPRSIADSVLSVLLEVTGGCTQAAKSGASPAFLSFALGWAGICVHFQISASLGGLRFSRIKFTLFRLLHGILSALLAGISFHFFPETAEVFSTVSHPIQPMMAADLTGSLMLLAVCAMFLLTLSAKNVDFRKKKC